MKKLFFKREEEASITYDADVGEEGINPFTNEAITVPAGNLTIYSQFKYHNNSEDSSVVVVSKETVDAAIADGTGVLYETQDKLDTSLRVARKRIIAYPSISEQLDMQYHDQVDGTTTWKDAITKIKTDNPK
jgi:hypothetical protein